MRGQNLTAMGSVIVVDNESDVRLQIANGPPNLFGYILVGTDLTFGPIIGQGRFCLSGPFGRYNVAGTPMDSIGQFNATGIFELIT